MAQKKYYAVRIGKNPGIYTSWSETVEQVKGFSGAEYKSFPGLEEAEKYMLAKAARKEENNNCDDINEEIQREINALKPKQVIAFVDGSYSPNVEGEEKYGFGAVLFTKNQEVKLFKSYTDSEYMESRNVAGEIKAVEEAILWGIENAMEEITIYYDYQGIERWATKEWKANKKLTKEYSEFYDEKSKLIKISFKHTKAHSGVIYNEEADKLAKKSLLS